MAALLRRATTSLRSTSKNRHFFSPAAHRIEATGLYGYSHLKSPNGFQRLVDDAIERSNELVGYISGMPSSEEIIKSMDEISNTVCQVLDSAELCRNTHPDREYVKEALKASMRLNEYLHYLNTNSALYDAVLKADKDQSLTSEEAKRVAHDLRDDFEKGGIHLSADKKDRVSQLNVEIAKYCAQYNENIAKEPGHVDVFPASRIPKNLHHLVKTVSRPSSLGSRGNFREKGFRIITEPSTVSAVLQWTSDDEVRKMTYIQGNSVPRANLRVLDKLIAARHEISQIMGYKSYVDYALHSNMASSPDVVSSFLVELSNIVRPKAVEEFESMRDFKRRKNDQQDLQLEPWDEAFFTRSMKSSAYNLDFSVVASYFSLSQCIEGLKVLVESLFGMNFVDIPLAPGESWHPDVLKMALHHPNEGDLGYIYLDLNSRVGKYPGCAHFAIRGGRRVSKTEYQLPVIALVCNFSKSQNSTAVRFNHSDVDTLFHEFGHALHSLLSRTDYQHFSGTRVAFDMAETPSNLFEYYAWDYRVLKKFARHYSTGDIIPEKLVESMQGAKKMFAATEMQQQILYALADQTLYGDQTLSPIDTTSIIADLKEQHTNWKHVEGTHWQTRFSHLVYYGEANRAVEVNEMWRARQKEKELDDRKRGRSNSDSQKNNNRYEDYERNHSSLCSSSKSASEDGLRDNEIEEFLHSRAKRGRGAVGSRMDEPGPYLPDSKEKHLANPDDLEYRESWDNRVVLGPEKPRNHKSYSSSDEESSSDESEKSAKRVSSKKHRCRKHRSKDKSKDKKKKKKEREKKRSKHHK